MLFVKLYEVFTLDIYFTSRANARIPAANGADAEVPVCLVVQVFLRSVVAWKEEKKKIILVVGTITN